jgi:ring-1,2-phenylacetyl-CoA epoxidase subunit PaaE
MAQFHSLKIKDIRRETADCVSISFDIPAELENEFKYKQGQYITLKETINGEELRRSYSACSSPIVDDDLRIAVKKVEGGRMSSYLNNGIEPGQTVEVMKPMGNFYTPMPSGKPSHYVGFAAGSGITPILSLLKTALAADDQNRFTLFYGNKTTEDIIFKDELDQLESKYQNRLKVIHILSREETSDPLFKGRISTEKCSELMVRFDATAKADEYFICGPYEMIKGVEENLLSRGISTDNIHFELFSTPPEEAEVPQASPAGEEDAKSNTPVDVSKATIVLDGDEYELEITKDQNILDAVLDAGMDAPYACTGGSCCTCRAKITSGHAIMDVNYALTDQEVKDNYVLTCQSHPTTATIVVDYDEP